MNPESLPYLIVAAGCFLLVGLVAWAGFARSPNRAMSAFLLVYGTLNLCIGVFFSAETYESQAYWYRVAWYFGLADALILAWFMTVYPRKRFAGGWLFLVAAGALSVGLAVWQPYFFTPPGPNGATSPLGFLGGVTARPALLIDDVLDLVYPAAAIVFARDALTGRASTAWRSCLLLAAGLPLLFVFRSTNDIIALALGLMPPPSGVVAITSAVLRVTQLLLVASLAAYVLWGARNADASIRAEATRLLSLPALVAITGAIFAFAGAASYSTPLGVTAMGLSFLLGPAVIAYAVVRHNFVGVDLRVKRTIRHGTLAAFFVAAYALTSIGTNLIVGPAAAPYLGTAAALLLVLAIVPLKRLADRAATSAMPGVADTPEYLTLRRLEVYRAALEERMTGRQALADADAPALARLRQALGITERDHTVLLLALSDRNAAGGALEWVPGAVVLGKYRTHGLLGAGAYGRTFLAEDIVRNGKVVVKTFLRGAAAARAVVREARAMAAVDHPNVVVAHQIEQVGDEAFLVMEYVEGGSLAQRITRDGPLTPQEFHTVARGLLSALAAVHQRGIVHRDVKPANILLTAAMEPKLADFGVAHLPDIAETQGTDIDMTGTLPYMSPEQARGHRTTSRSDLFSAAVTLYEAATGRRYAALHEGESAFELRVRIARGFAYEHPPDIDPGLAPWFENALDPAPEHRFPDAMAMQGTLDDAFALITRQQNKAENDQRQ